MGLGELSDGHFWLDDDSAPYATLLRVIETYCHPSAPEGAYGQLKAHAKSTSEVEMRVFKRQMEAVISRPRRLPGWVLFAAAKYDEGDDVAFLKRLWSDLYNEPTPLVATAGPGWCSCWMS